MDLNFVKVGEKYRVIKPQIVGRQQLLAPNLYQVYVCEDVDKKAAAPIKLEGVYYRVHPHEIAPVMTSNEDIKRIEDNAERQRKALENFKIKERKIINVAELL